MLLLTVARANRAPVVGKQLPPDLGALLGTDWQMELPLFLVILGAVAVGVLIGFVWEWFREMRIRGDARAKSREVARLALDNIAEGPKFVPSERYRGMFEQLTAMPRRDALISMEQNMRSLVKG